MKVKDLIYQLQKLDQESVVVLSKDEEGNYFDYLYRSVRFQDLYRLFHKTITPNKQWQDSEQF